MACSQGRVRRSLRTPVRHAASAQMVGVDRATARSARCACPQCSVQSQRVPPSVGTGCVAASRARLCCACCDGAPQDGRPVSSLGVPRHHGLFVSCATSRSRRVTLCVGGSDARVQRLPVFKSVENRTHVRMKKMMTTPPAQSAAARLQACSVHTYLFLVFFQI